MRLLIRLPVLNTPIHLNRKVIKELCKFFLVKNSIFMYVRKYHILNETKEKTRKKVVYEYVSQGCN